MRGLRTLVVMGLVSGLWCLTLSIAGFTPSAHAQSAKPEAASVPGYGLDQSAAIAASQSVLGQVPADVAFVDSQGMVRRLSEFRGKPVLVNFIYTGCFEVCPTSSRALRAAVLGMRERFGDQQFEVLSIGFNQPSDSPVALREFAARQRIDDANWHFLAPAVSDVAALSEAFGFRFAATPLGFDHTLQVSILDAEGRLHQQVYGDAFAADALGEPLKQLLGGELVTNTRSLGDLIDRVRILCSVYDPVTGKYRTDWGLYLEIAGGLTFILTMLGLGVQEWWRQRRRVVVQVAP